MDGLFQPTHIILILVAALVIFGPKRLPEIGKTLGRGIREFKGALNSVDLGTDDETPKPAGPPADGTPENAPPTE